jgi:cation:H+ antiporter
MLAVLLLIGGFVLLVFGASWLVDGSAALARRYHIPNMVIGLTIVAFGTSSPELVVSVLAATQHNSAIALGNVVGSNVFNIGAILGITALIRPIVVKNNTTWIEIPMSGLSALVLLIVGLGSLYFDRAPEDVITRTEGALCLCFFAIFLVYNLISIKGNGVKTDLDIKSLPLYKSVLMVAAGLVMLYFGGRFSVNGATSLARLLGISEKVIAVTIISAGTSLPELVTSIIAARKKNLDMAIGNVVGSNIFNVFLILGLAALIDPVTVGRSSHPDIYFNLILSILLFVFIFTFKGRKLDRWEGLVLVLMYLFYIGIQLIPVWQSPVPG